MSDGAQLIKDLLIARGSGAGNQAGYLPQPAAPKGSKLQIYLYLFILLPNVAQPFRQATCGVFSQRERNRKSARVPSALRSLANETNGNETRREKERDRHRLRLRLRRNRVRFLGQRQVTKAKGTGVCQVSFIIIWPLIRTHSQAHTETHTHSHIWRCTLCSCEAFFGASAAVAASHYLLKVLPRVASSHALLNI